MYHLTEGPGREGGDETALPAVGTCVSCTQLPEPHPGESAAGSASAGHGAEDTQKLSKSQSEKDFCKSESGHFFLSRTCCSGRVKNILTAASCWEQNER